VTAGIPILPMLGSNIRLLVEMAWGADLTDATGASWVWSDISLDLRYNRGQGVSISVGRRNEMSVATPATCTFQLNNNSGAYTPYNPMSSLWPNVRRNTPVRVRASLDGGSTWAVRFQGYATEFTPSWDEAAAVAVITVTAADISRRLSQGNSPLKSAMYRAVTANQPLAYWPLEDAAGSTSAGSAVPAAKQMNVISGKVAFGAVNGPAGVANKLPNLVTGAGVMSGTVPRGSAASWRLALLFQCPSPLTSSPTSIHTVLTWTTPGATRPTWDVDLSYFASPAGFWVQAEAWNAAGNNATGVVRPPVGGNLWDDGNWHLAVIDATQNGTRVDFTLTVDGGTPAASWEDPATLAPIGMVTINGSVTGGDNSTTNVAGVAIWSPIPASSPNLFTAMSGYVGETPGARMTRLCGEEGVPFSIVDYYDTTQTMGAQTVDTFMNLLRESERADAGFLYGGLSIGMRYQGISQRYDQAAALTLDATKDLRFPFAPVDDDQRTVNLAVVSRKNGSSATAQKVDGPLGTAAIGTYDTLLTVNTADDLRLYDRASWETWAGGQTGFRYPALSMSMLTNSTLVSRWLNRTDGVSGPVIPGCHLDITNVVTALPQQPSGTVAVVLEGYQETINTVDWQISANLSQNRQYDVVKIGDSQLGRPDTDGAYLAAAAGNGATSLTVATVAGMPPWTTTATYPADFPLNYNVDGLQVAVSGIASVATDGFTRTVSNGWGSADSGQAWSTSGGTAAAYSVGSGWGQMALSSVATIYTTLLDVGSVDAKNAIDVNLPVASGTGSAIRVRAGVRAADDANMYFAQLELGTDGLVRLTIQKRVGGVDTLLSSNVVVSANTASDWWHLEMSAVGSTLTALAKDLTHPGGPQLLTLTDAAITSGTKVAEAATLVTGYSGATPVTIAWDHFEVSNPQVFTVGALPRAVAARKTVELWNPGAIKF
jgi:hypothetical protein